MYSDSDCGNKEIKKTSNFVLSSFLTHMYILYKIHSMFKINYYSMLFSLAGNFYNVYIYISNSYLYIEIDYIYFY